MPHLPQSYRRPGPVQSARTSTILKRAVVRVRIVACGCRLDRFDHRPTELRQVEWRLPSFHSTPVRAGEPCARYSSLAVTTVEDDPHLTRVPKLTVKHFVPVEPSARDDEDDHAVLPVLAWQRHDANKASSIRTRLLSRVAKC